MKPSNRGAVPDQVTYRISVRGRLDEHWSDWFNGMLIACESDCEGAPLTTLTVTAADQARLRGILSRIWDLNLAVISVLPIELEEGKGR